MRASVIILNWNGLAVLEPCLAAIAANTDIDDYEVIVLDNGSVEPGVEEAVRPYPKARLIKEPVNHGFSRGNNIAARAARGEYVVILNNDTVPAPGWLSPLLSAVRDDVGIAGARLVDASGRILFAGSYFQPAINAYVPAYRNYPGGSASEARECEAYIACGIALRRDLFLAVGGFDEGYFQGYEDVDLCLKVRERGLKVMYCPESVIEHLENVSMNQLGRSRRRQSKERNREHFERRWRVRLHEFRLPRLPDGLEDFALRERFDQALFDAVSAGAGNVLHLGCGTGALGERLKSSGKAMRVAGVEADATAAAIARERLDEAWQGELASLPVETLSGRYDTLLLGEVLSQLADPWGALFSLRDCLKDGGTLLARFHNAAHYKLIKRLASRDWRYEPSGLLQHANLRFFSRGSIEDLLVYAGFDVLRIDAEASGQPLWRIAGRFSARAADLGSASYLVTAKKRPARPR